MNEKAKLEQEYQAQIKEGILTYQMVFNLPTAFDNNLEISFLKKQKAELKAQENAKEHILVRNDQPETYRKWLKKTYPGKNRAKFWCL